MADSPTLLPSDRPAEPLVYRPLSGLAIASLAVAALYAVVVTGIGVFALGDSTPLTMGLWTLIFPLAALLLALAGRQQIRQSEGTRSGLALTTWAWWLSLLFGLGYLAFYVGTFLAVWWQAESEAMQFFAQVREGKTDEAFKDHIIDPAQRNAPWDLRKL